MAPPARTALLERETELASLSAAATTVAADRDGRLLLVEGESGIGKSALLAAGRELAAGAGLGVAACRGLAVERDVPYGVVVRLLEPLLHHAEPAVWDGIGARAHRLFGRPAGTGTPAGGDVRHELFRLVRRLALQGDGLCLAIDDAQDADAVSLAFLHHLASRLGHLPLLLLVAGRPVRRGGNAVRLAELALQADAVYVLRPLTDAAVAEMVRRAEPAATAALCESCARTCQGNPFLLSQLLASLQGRLTAVTPEEVALLRPDAVSRSVLVRLASLSSGAVALARAAAVVGDGAPVGTAAAVAAVERPTALALLDELADASICSLDADGRLAFGHPVVEAVVHDEIPAALREQLHAAAAATLHAAGAPDADVRRHLLRGARGVEDWALAVLRRHAAEAVAEGLPDEAVRDLQRVLEEPLDVRTRAAVTAELATARRGGDPACLTAAERRVVALARTGCTNREIAEQLCLSAKTVEYHLGNVFAKLQIRSRRELRAGTAVPVLVDAG
jgi:DNA-binding CsgD family transcriptional regulator